MDIVDGRCRMAVRIEGSARTDIGAFSVFWHNAFVANKVCGSQGKRAAVINLGTIQVDAPQSHDTDINLKARTVTLL